jgi:hypothetical protein
LPHVPYYIDGNEFRQYTRYELELLIENVDRAYTAVPIHYTRFRWMEMTYQITTGPKIELLYYNFVKGPNNPVIGLTKFSPCRWVPRM